MAASMWLSTVAGIMPEYRRHLLLRLAWSRFSRHESVSICGYFHYSIPSTKSKSKGEATA